MSDVEDGAGPDSGQGEDLYELVTELIETLSAKGETIATAESLTGGLIGARFTDVAGSSAVYRGGVVSYATDLKASLAGVRQQTLAEHGAVSALTAVEMALGVARRCDASWGVAVTGVAGPDEQEGHPVGTVFTAVVRRTDDPDFDDGESDSVVCVRELRLPGDRAEIRAQTVRAALRQVRQVCSPN
ncbi:CinA family protein [Microlunatus soli]|uniref:Nicotinamide-nucleotide amidase n=1 Tax=Microlunatus soli TaxID=630515 RepID=A0A1H1ZI20_9ACTN|nr:nicotinamide-nucleotide amidohydrolase family protein [Microlunatus soli]SDT33293.1 nicotinamide-nucleotide amidase [Microlunatus soli]